MPSAQILVNTSTIAITDRGFHYGDASFSTMYAKDRRIVLLHQHLGRLQDACLKLNISFTQWSALEQSLRELCDSCASPTVIKVIISRGSGGRGYEPPVEAKPVCIISTHAAEDMRSQTEIEKIGVSDIYLPSHAQIEGVKHNNRLAQVMAKHQSSQLGFDDVLMCDEQNQVIEASSANVFYFLDDCWHAPSLQSGGVQGLMRSAFIEYLRSEGYFINFAKHHIKNMSKAESLLLTNAVKGVRAVKTLSFQDSLIHYQNSQKQLIQSFLAHLFQQDRADS